MTTTMTTTMAARAPAPARMTVSVPPHAGVARTDDMAPAARDTDDDTPGCGWYDSSFELRHGLDVIELGSAAAGFFRAALS